MFFLKKGVILFMYLLNFFKNIFKRKPKLIEIKQGIFQVQR